MVGVSGNITSASLGNLSLEIFPLLDFPRRGLRFPLVERSIPPSADRSTSSGIFNPSPLGEVRRGLGDTREGCTALPHRAAQPYEQRGRSAQRTQHVIFYVIFSQRL